MDENCSKVDLVGLEYIIIKKNTYLPPVTALLTDPWWKLDVEIKKMSKL